MTQRRRKQGRSPDGPDWRVERAGSSAVLFRRGEPEPIVAEWFRDRHWRKRNLVVGEQPGRGTVLFVRRGERTWVLRHYRRGGAVARLTADLYLWTGLERTRPFREWRLLRRLHEEGLPVPSPVAAHVRRSGLTWRGDIITERIADTRSLASAMTAGVIDAGTWEAVGATLRRFHDRGVDHADLNAHNVLLDPGMQVFLVDFDRSAVRSGAGWKRRNLNRLRRSLDKIIRSSGGAFGESDWRRLLRAYGSEA
ncbi:MAG: 3-deoxy-D-manno-octulosonic acid kinase [Rhodospirillaceae bacterium]|nr:3-deoxy-D-manno-octulosonic acid kinase [Rhodospirillaceae bacterium]